MLCICHVFLGAPSCTRHETQKFPLKPHTPQRKITILGSAELHSARNAKHSVQAPQAPQRHNSTTEDYLTTHHITPLLNQALALRDEPSTTRHSQKPSLTLCPVACGVASSFNPGGFEMRKTMMSGILMLATAGAIAQTTTTTTTNVATSGTQQYDVVVYGGTASGVATAIAAAREGSTVALLEPTKHIGGMVTGGLGMTDFGNKKCIGGFALEFYERLGKYYSKPIEWYPEPHVAEETLTAMLKDAKVPVFFEHRLQENNGVTTEPGRIKSITMENGTVFNGDIFADCSYEGDLMAKSGVSYTYGREGDDQYDEPLAGVRERTPYHQFTVNVKARGEDGKLLPGIQDGPKGEPGQADKKVQAYNFRMCMTTATANKVAFPKPDNYDPARFELLARMIDAWEEKNGAPPKVAELMHPGRIQKSKTDTNNNKAFSTDYIGGSWTYPDATYTERDNIWQDHYDYQAGFMYFLANDEQVPQVLRDEMNTWGLAADEFLDTNHWPRQLYVREGRRMVSDFVMTQSDIQTSRTKEDVIGMGSYNSDSHNVQRFENAEGFAENEGDMQVSVKPYQIPYRIMTPKKSEIQNLLVPVTLSASHVVYSTVRMEPQYMIMGQAAGIAASMAAKNDVAVQDIDSAALTNRLKELKAVLEL